MNYINGEKIMEGDVVLTKDETVGVINLISRDNYGNLHARVTVGTTEKYYYRFEITLKNRK